MSEIVPVTREEKLVDAIIDSEVIADKGVTRAEKYLEHIMNGTTATEEPVTRAEHYLASIAGMDVQLEEPVTRVEIYLAAIAGMTVDLPAPVTRLEKLLAEWAEASAGELKTVTGAVVAVSDALARKAEDLTVAITPVQSGTGTPSPDNVRPITGHEAVNVTRTGKNLFFPTNYGGTFYSATVGGNLAIERSITAIETDDGYGVVVDAQWYGKVFSTGVLPVGDYHFHMTAEDGIRFALYITDEDYIVLTASDKITTAQTLDKTLTLTQPSRIVAWVGSRDVGTVYVHNFQCETGQSFTAYSTYVGDTYDVQFPAEAGTVYGGQLDVTTGVLTVDKVKVVLQDLSNVNVNNWYSADASKSTWGWYINTADWMFDKPVTNYLISESYQRVNSVYGYDIPYIASITFLNGAFQYISFRLNKSDIGVPESYADLSVKIRAYIAEHPITLCIEIAPKTYQLTPTEITMLLGDNTLWADTGDSTLKYWAEVEE